MRGGGYRWCRGRGREHRPDGPRPVVEVQKPALFAGVLLVCTIPTPVMGGYAGRFDRHYDRRVLYCPRADSSMLSIPTLRALASCVLMTGAASRG